MNQVGTKDRLLKFSEAHLVPLPHLRGPLPRIRLPHPDLYVRIGSYHPVKDPLGRAACLLLDKDDVEDCGLSERSALEFSYRGKAK